MKFNCLILLVIVALLAGNASAQLAERLSGGSDSLVAMPSNYLTKVSAKANQLEEKLDKKSEKALNEMLDAEKRIQSKLSKIDSSKAKQIFTDGEQKYKNLKEKLTSKTKVFGQYIPSLDTLSTSLKFLQQNQELLSKTKEVKEKLDKALANVNGLEDKLQQAEQIKVFLKERKEYLQQQLQQLGFAKELKQINKQLYYYNQQLNEYKSLLKDHEKAERKAIELLSKTKFFQDFMRKNSMLASLFRMPGDPTDPSYTASLAGLQTRTQVNNLIQRQVASGGPGAQAQFRQNLQQGQSQLNELKEKLLKSPSFGNGGGGSDDIMAQGFKPNNQKTKSFLQRLEYGTNIQTQRATYFFPVTTDLGLSVGYKLNDKSVIGIGASYKMGFGRGWNNVEFTSEGAGLRSYVDWKLKGSIWISGGYEMNYRTTFKNFAQLQDMTAWQQSGLLGLSKVIDVKSKFFKKTKLQLLWDFLSYRQVPGTHPILFRIGYNMK